MPAMDNFSKSSELSASHTYKEDSFLILFILYLLNNYYLLDNFKLY